MFSSCCGCGNKKANLKVANDDDPVENNCDNENDGDGNEPEQTGNDSNEQPPDTGAPKPINQKESVANAATSSDGTNALVDQTPNANKLDNESVQCGTVSLLHQWRY